ncbi:hypothetical protein [Xanthomonas arboricola]
MHTSEHTEASPSPELLHHGLTLELNRVGLNELLGVITRAPRWEKDTEQLYQGAALGRNRER